MPDASLAEEWAAKERSRLEAAKAAMGEEELADVIRSTADLKRAQLAEDSAEDLATIPRVGLADLEAKAYSAFMHGNVALERENWAPALASFKSTATICTELARVTMAEQAALYKQAAARRAGALLLGSRSPAGSVSEPSR